jgi:hypothetical protein
LPGKIFNADQIPDDYWANFGKQLGLHQGGTADFDKSQMIRVRESVSSCNRLAATGCGWRSALKVLLEKLARPWAWGSNFRVGVAPLAHPARWKSMSE